MNGVKKVKLFELSPNRRILDFFVGHKTLDTMVAWNLNAHVMGMLPYGSKCPCYSQTKIGRGIRILDAKLQVLTSFSLMSLTHSEKQRRHNGRQNLSIRYALFITHVTEFQTMTGFSRGAYTARRLLSLSKISIVADVC